MGLNDPGLYEDDRAILDRLIAGTPFKGGFDELKRIGTATIFPEPVLHFADLEFPTPSGKIEIASDQAVADGQPRTPTPSVDPRPAGGRLRLLSPASPWIMNSSYGNDPAIAAKAGPEAVTLPPHDAAARGLREGDPVTAASDIRALTPPVHAAPLGPPGAAPATQAGGPNKGARDGHGRAPNNDPPQGKK